MGEVSERHIAQAVQWRRELHTIPELGLQEQLTSDFVAQKLESFGLVPERYIAETGIVASLKGRGNSERAIALRADMDALPIPEANEFAHKSTHEGLMHACGHDGHTATLLGAARHLCEHRNFDGTVHFIFQPAEENAGGANLMVQEGLFDRFPCEAVYGLHNMPGIPAGHFHLRPGPFMAAVETFKITVRAQGCHAAKPQTGIDTLLAAAQLVNAAQSIVARNVGPRESGVVSITTFHAGNATNVIPDVAELSGCIRYFEPKVGETIVSRLKTLVETIPQAFGATGSLEFLPDGYPPTINDPEHAMFLADVAESLVGAEAVDRQCEPEMGSEDFSYMLQAKPGSYVFVGAGGEPGSCLLHNPHYDYNDDIVGLGMRFWARVVERALPLSGV